MDRNEVAGKVVMFHFSPQIKEVQRAGALAAIILTDVSLGLSPEDYSLPSLLLSEASANLVIEYVTKERNPKVKSMTFVHTKLGTKPAPQVAVFSSKGPNPITPGILKPDIIAPGMDVLAAYVPNKPRVTVGNYGLVTDYALSTGTSMSTPVVAGVAALLRAVHPEWSPAAVRSALMTTAYVVLRSILLIVLPHHCKLELAILIPTKPWILDSFMTQVFKIMWTFFAAWGTLTSK